MRIWLLLLCTALLPAQDPEQTPPGRTHYLGREIAQTMHWTGAPWLLRATRDDEENGTLLRQWLALQPGQAVCDLGCGNGYHTLPIAEQVGAAGTVYAVELQPKMLELLQLRAEPRGLANLKYVACTVDDPKLEPASCDVVLMVDVYHELSHPVRVMAHVRRALKPGGRVVLVEFRAEDPAVPIKPEHTMTKAQIVREMATHGFAADAAFDALPWQHAMSFVAAEPDARLGPRQLLRALLRAANGGDLRVVAPFLAGGLLADDLPALAADCRTELRAGPDGTVLAALRTATGEPLAHGRDEVVRARDGDGRWFVGEVRPPLPLVFAHGARQPFVAMHTGLGRLTPEAQIDLLAELGFDGIAADLSQLPALRRAAEGRGLDVYSAYAVLDLPADAGAELLAERVEPARQAMRALAGGPGMLWLALRGSDASSNAAAVRALLATARTTGVEIALYPHHGFGLATIDQAVRLCDQLDDPNLGICFNLCHFLRSGDAADLGPALQRSGTRLFAVTVNGADRDGTDWPGLIQPLDRGTLGLGGVRDGLEAARFTGVVGLQAYGITLPPREHLTRSMAAWRAAHR